MWDHVTISSLLIDPCIGMQGNDEKVRLSKAMRHSSQTIHITSWQLDWQELMRTLHSENQHSAMPLMEWSLNKKHDHFIKWLWPGSAECIRSVHMKHLAVALHGHINCPLSQACFQKIPIKICNVFESFETCILCPLTQSAFQFLVTGELTWWINFESLLNCLSIKKWPILVLWYCFNVLLFNNGEFRSCGKTELTMNKVFILNLNFDIDQCWNYHFVSSSYF